MLTTSNIRHCLDARVPCALLWPNCSLAWLVFQVKSRETVNDLLSQFHLWLKEPATSRLRQVSAEISDIRAALKMMEKCRDFRRKGCFNPFSPNVTERRRPGSAPTSPFGDRRYKGRNYSSHSSVLKSREVVLTKECKHYVATPISAAIVSFFIVFHRIFEWFWRQLWQTILSLGRVSLPASFSLCFGEIWSKNWSRVEWRMSAWRWWRTEPRVRLGKRLWRIKCCIENDYFDFDSSYWGSFVWVIAFWWQLCSIVDISIVTLAVTDLPEDSPDTQNIRIIEREKQKGAWPCRKWLHQTRNSVVIVI